MGPVSRDAHLTGSGLGTHCKRKRRLNAAVLRARLLLSPHSSHLDSALPAVHRTQWGSSLYASLVLSEPIAGSVIACHCR